MSGAGRLRPGLPPRRTPAPVILLAVMGTLLLTTASRAEVTVNPRALDQLGGQAAHETPPEHGTPAHPAPAHGPAHPAPSHPTPPHPAQAHPEPAHPAAARPTPPRPPTVPPAPPPVAVLPPLNPPPPAHPTAPPPPAPIVADAVGVASEIPTGTRVTFGQGSADLNAATNNALREVARASPNGIFNVTAYAAGVPDDPSTPRRLSLSRALAARSLLIAEGIPSPRIYVRAAGPNVPDGPPDRVDVTVTIPPAAAAAAPSGTPAAIPAPPPASPTATATTPPRKQ